MFHMLIALRETGLSPILLLSRNSAGIGYMPTKPTIGALSCFHVPPRMVTPSLIFL